MCSYMFCEKAQQLITFFPPENAFEENTSLKIVCCSLNKQKANEGAREKLLYYCPPDCQAFWRHTRTHRACPAPLTHAATHRNTRSILNRKCKKDPSTNANPLPGEFGNRTDGKTNQKSVMAAKERLPSPSHIPKWFLKVCLKTKQWRNIRALPLGKKKKSHEQK